MRRFALLFALIIALPAHAEQEFHGKHDASDVPGELEVCMPGKLSEVDCDKGSVMLVHPRLVPYVCDYSREIFVLEYERAVQSDDFSVSCVYAGQNRGNRVGSKVIF